MSNQPITALTTRRRLSVFAAGVLSLSSLTGAQAWAAPKDISNDSPTSVSCSNTWSCEAKDLNRIAKVVQYKDQWHSNTTFLKTCSKNSPTSLTVDRVFEKEGEPSPYRYFKVTDCGGVESKAFYFHEET